MKEALIVRASFFRGAAKLYLWEMYFGNIIFIGKNGDEVVRRTVLRLRIRDFER